MKQRILGLDTGTNSLGWAVVDRDENNNYELIKKGVLIFQEGVKIEKGVESSKAAERTGYRLMRRQYFRRRLRKIEVLKVLIKYDFCPAISEEDLKLWHVRKIYPAKPEFMEWQRTNDDTDQNPYACRYVCTTRKLDLTKVGDRYTLGRALYHLSQRRGFLSNRLDKSGDNSEQSVVKKGISQLSQEIQSAGCNYLGEYFYKLYKEFGNKVRIRTKYTDRETHYLAEFNAICAKQNLPKEMRDELAKALYFQRPLKSQRMSVGKCVYEKNKSRVSTSHYAFEEFRMLSFVNNIRIKTPKDDAPRPLNQEEFQKIEKLFYRKSKPSFDFEDIAKEIAGKGQYMHRDDNADKPYVFNYRMSQGVPGCPTIAQLRSIFGTAWKTGIAELYTLNLKRNGVEKTLDEMADDVWNILFFFDSEEKLAEFATEKLQLDTELAKKFSKIDLNRDYASISLKALRKILPFLRCGMGYSHAVFLANIPTILKNDIWAFQPENSKVINKIADIVEHPKANCEKGQSLEDKVKDYLKMEYNLSDEEVAPLYHPSMMETYPEARANKDGVILLGSPLTNAVRNPMAMRSLHQLRKVVNSFIQDGTINRDTIVHIEYARELHDANQRAALYQWQREQERKRAGYAAAIRDINVEPTDTDILKYQLWEEQGHQCPYTGREIALTDFLGASPSFDIEHTIPRSVGGDSTQENLTLCDSRFNREIKKTKIPSQLSNHEEILECIKGWKKKIDDLSKQIDKLSHGRSADKKSNDARIQKKNKLKMERNYWQGKYNRFTMTEVPEGFARRQGAGIGLVSKYAALYLKSYFKDIEKPERNMVYSIKGTVTAEFRKMWGLQELYEKKSRDNHAHHCIDAIVIACVGKREMDASASYYRRAEERKWTGSSDKPHFAKPWPTFTEDVKHIAEDLLVVHHTSDNMPKKASRRVKVKGHGKKVAQGDAARNRLHNETYYGAIERNGEIRYVVRRDITSFESIKDLDKIVDDVVREKVIQAVKGKTFKEAIAQPIYMNEEKGVLIKRVRCYVPSVKSPLHIRRHRDQSPKEYKQQCHVVNDSNYCMAIYEGEVRGRLKREFKLVNMLDTAAKFKCSGGERGRALVEKQSANKLPWKQTIKVGTNVLLYEKNPSEIYKLDTKGLSDRLYKVVGLSSMFVTNSYYGVIFLRHSAESRPAKDIKSKNGAYKQGEMLRPAITMLHTQLNVLVEGQDFKMNPLGEIIFK